MKNFVALAAAMFAIVAFADTCSAQNYDGGYRFGAGFAYGVQNGRYGNHYGHNYGYAYRGIRPLGTIGVLRRVEEPPYFAQQPPVYYSGIIRRPYGISPYATPPGILPTEMTVLPSKPVTIGNPYFDNSAVPVSEENEQAQDEVDNKTTSVVNPYAGSISSK